ncbi:MAG TPA: cytochrome P450 [Actinophytocola sp.]|uniref:cytochrome P450 family protein n=1 Tax=Actinophytocola sp. TaxID=1872138 RepID=UPI002DDD5C2E|nr:cytochrome P450 [Actinophytocola sp.]HEV2780407.1 cytochrome P450 [Actinophytocola sp.]
MIPFSAQPTEKIDSRGGRCMYAQLDHLRAAAPAVPVELPEGFSAWLVTRGDVVRFLLTHPGVSRNLKRNVPGYEPGEVAWLSPWVDVESMSTAEGREHQRLRKLVAPALTPRRIDAMRPHLEVIAADLLDELAARPAGEPVDLHTAYSQQLPTRMICDLFGVPADLRPEVLRILRVVLNTDDVPEEESAAVYNDMNVAMRILIEGKRRAPGDDLTSFLLAARVEGEAPLSEQELVDMLLLLIGGGSQTTVSLIDHTVRELLANPRQLATVLADPARWTDAIEESLRVHCPVSSLPMRWAKEDIDLGDGVVIRAGDAILINYLAHGRDPGLHANPDVYDIDRANKEHLAFGLGPHFCPGARLARLEAAVAVPALFDRFPNLALAVEPEQVEPLRSFIANDVAALPVLLRHHARNAA